MKILKKAYGEFCMPFHVFRFKFVYATPESDKIGSRDSLLKQSLLEMLSICLTN